MRTHLANWDTLIKPKFSDMFWFLKYFLLVVSEHIQIEKCQLFETIDNFKVRLIFNVSLITEVHDHN